MKEEHFGISIVEMMAAGLITIAHDSAGPKLDIIGKSSRVVGFLCNDEQEYANAVKIAISQYDDVFYRNLRQDAREWVTQQFGLKTFEDKFTEMIVKVL